MICLKTAYLECKIPERNRAAFYNLIAGRDLFGLILIRHWGRIGTKGQPKLRHRYTSEHELMHDFHRVLKKRLRHRYKFLERKEKAIPPLEYRKRKPRSQKQN